ncbi:BrxA family protein [Bacillus pacificus]
MKEVIQEKLEANNYLLEKKDLNIFFLSKTEQDEKVAKWTELTINKLKQVYIKLLLEAGLLRDKKSGELNRLLIDEELKRHFISIGDFSYLQAMGE